MITVSPNIQCREDMPAALRDSHGIGRLAVEIGVLRGEYSVVMLDSFSGQVVGVDPYVPFWEAPGDRTEHLSQAYDNLQVYGDRYRLFIEKDSHELADKIVDEYGRPDFVYIDADHKYAPCKKDIAIWWPRLSDGGVLAGHDYTDLHPGVVRAVHELANDHRVYVTHEDEWKSWYCFKESDSC